MRQSPTSGSSGEAEGSKFKITDLTLKGGVAPVNTFGGAIYTEGTLELINCKISENQAFRGGGIYCTGILISEECTIENNEAIFGGGIYSKGSMGLHGSKVTDNTAQLGGGIFVEDGTVGINNSEITDNRATVFFLATGAGGGLFLASGVLAATITNTQIKTNLSDFMGGAIFVEGGSENIITTLTLRQSTIDDNTSHYGGGVAIQKDNLHLENTSITSNHTWPGQSGAGGGIYIGSAVVAATFLGSTIAGNSATSEGGGIWVGVGHGGVNTIITLYDTWVVGNTAETAGGGIYIQEQATGDTPHLLLQGDSYIAMNELTAQNSVGGR